MLDAARLGPADNATAVTAAQLRAVVERLITAGRWHVCDPDILIVADVGYDTRLAFVLADVSVELLRPAVLRPRPAATAPAPVARHRRVPAPPRPEFALNKPATWPAPQHTTVTATRRYGTATATSWNRLHPRLTHRGCCADHDGELPVIAGTLIRLQVEHLPGVRDPKPVWLWSSATGATAADVNRCWQSFLPGFDLERF